MRLMPARTPKYSEDEMQKGVFDYFTARKFRPSDHANWNLITPKVYREIRIPQIGRISDVIVYITDRKIVNIECKLVDYGIVLQQAKDHLKWADYSYVCLPAEIYLPAYILDAMINYGIGLLFWHQTYFVEVLQSGYNKQKDKELRKQVMSELKKRDSLNTSIIEKQLIF